jgi:hypothetical protein
MDCSNFTEFIEQSNNDKNSNQEAKVEYHAWRLLLDEAATTQMVVTHDDVSDKAAFNGHF